MIGLKIKYMWYYCLYKARGLNKLWHKWVVQHNRRVLGRPSFVGGCGSLSTGKFWSLRVLQMNFPAFWGPFLFCFVLRSQTIWTNFEGKKQHLLKLIPDRCTIYWQKKKRNMISKFNHKKLALHQCPQLTFRKIVNVQSLLI